MHAHCFDAPSALELSLNPIVNTFSSRRHHHRRCRHRRLARFRRIQGRDHRHRQDPHLLLRQHRRPGHARRPGSRSTTQLRRRSWRQRSPRSTRTSCVGIKTAHYWAQPAVRCRAPAVGGGRSRGRGGRALRHAGDGRFLAPCCRSAPIRHLILEKMRPGDIHTHVFAQQFPIIDAEGKRLRHPVAGARARASSSTSATARPASGSATPPRPSSRASSRIRSAPTSTPATSTAPVIDMLDDDEQDPATWACRCREVIAKSTVAPAQARSATPSSARSRPARKPTSRSSTLREGDFSYIDCGRFRFDGTSKLTCDLTSGPARSSSTRPRIGQPDWTTDPEILTRPLDY